MDGIIVDSYENKARKLHQEGNNCSTSLHHAFLEDFKLSNDFPAPRSIEGKCGALLTALKILKEKGYQNEIENFEKEFIEKFGSSKCVDINFGRIRCNDYVGEVAVMLEKIINTDRGNKN